MKIQKRALIQYLLLYIILIMHGAIVWATKYALSYPALILVGFLAVIVIYKYRIVIPQWLCLSAIMLGILYVMSGVFAGETLSHGFNFRTLIQIYLNFLVAYAAISVDRDGCMTRFIRLVFFFAVISLIGYLICNLEGVNTLKSVLPSYKYGTSSRTYYGKYLFSVLWGQFEQDAYTRNIGIYYEPGVYEIVLNCSIFILIYMRKYLKINDKAVIRMLSVFMITLVTTKSTTGYLGLAAILFGVILLRDKTKLRTRLISLAVVLIGILVIDYFSNEDSSLLSIYVIQKLQSVELSDSYNYTSGSARMIPVRIALQSLKENPFFGIGTSRVENATASVFGATGGTGNALFRMISSKGLMATVLLLYMLFRPAWRSRQSNIVFWVFAFMVLNVSFAQAQITYPSFVLIAIAGTVIIPLDEKVE